MRSTTITNHRQDQYGVRHVPFFSRQLSRNHHLCPPGRGLSPVGFSLTTKSNIRSMAGEERPWKDIDGVGIMEFMSSSTAPREKRERSYAIDSAIYREAQSKVLPTSHATESSVDSVTWLPRSRIIACPETIQPRFYRSNCASLPTSYHRN